jgi:4-oxalocrotonate tautomerase
MPFINVLVSHAPDPSLAQKIAEGVTERTVRILRKSPELTAAAVGFVPAGQWMIGGRSLEKLDAASFWLDVKVTAGTNSPAEKSAYIAEIHAFMAQVLGRLRPESYVLVHEVAPDAWGFGGITQARRYGGAEEATVK